VPLKENKIQQATTSLIQDGGARTHQSTSDPLTNNKKENNIKAQQIHKTNQLEKYTILMI